MTEEDLRIERLRLEIPTTGLDNSATQKQLLGYIVYAAVNADPSGPDQEGSIPEEPDLEKADLGEADFVAPDHDL